MEITQKYRQLKFFWAERIKKLQLGDGELQSGWRIITELGFTI